MMGKKHGTIEKVEAVAKRKRLEARA